MLTVPFLRLTDTYDECGEALDAAYRRVMASGHFILGPELEAFEQEFAAYCGARFCIGVGNGLEALELVLRAWDIGPGDEVIVPGHTFIATWLAVTKVGATPVGVDVDEYFNLDPARVEAAITARTRAIIPVHLYGHPANLDPIVALAKTHRLQVLEDAAQAHGALYNERRVGALGDAAAFSFYPGKNLGAYGDGGAITTHDLALAERLRKLRNYGCEKKYHHEEMGTNSRLDELQSAFLRVRLASLDCWNEQRRARAAYYDKRLRDLPGLRLPQTAPWAVPVWHIYAVRVAERDRILDELGKRSIGAGIHYPVPPHRQEAYRDLSQPHPLPLSEQICAEQLSLPMGPHLRFDQIDLVIEALGSLLGKA